MGGSPFPSWREPSKKKGSRLPRFGRNRLGSCSKLASQQTIPERRLVSCRAEFSRGERNFWMQRPEAKNPPERPLWSAETRNVENSRQDPRRNGLVSIDDGFCGSGRLDGGVRSRIRTRLSGGSTLETAAIRCFPLSLVKTRN